MAYKADYYALLNIRDSVNMLIIKSSCASKVGAACGVLQVFVCLARAVSPFVVRYVLSYRGAERFTHYVALFSAFPSPQDG